MDREPDKRGGRRRRRTRRGDRARPAGERHTVCENRPPLPPSHAHRAVHEIFGDPGRSLLAAHRTLIAAAGSSADPSPLSAIEALRHAVPPALSPLPSFPAAVRRTYTLRIFGDVARSMLAAHRALIGAAGLRDDLSPHSAIEALRHAVQPPLERPLGSSSDDTDFHWAEKFLTEPNARADPFRDMGIALLHTHWLWWRSYSKRICSAVGCGRPARRCCKRCHAFRFCGSECIQADWSWKARDGKTRSLHRAACAMLTILYGISFECDDDDDTELHELMHHANFRPPRSSLKALLRKYDAAGIRPPPFYGYLVHTDAPLEGVIHLLYVWKECWCELPCAAFFRSLDPRVRRLALALMASRMCCRPEVALLVRTEGSDYPRVRYIPIVVHPCACHDHGRCMRSADGLHSYRSLGDDVLAFIDDEREIAPARVLPPCVNGYPLHPRITGLTAPGEFLPDVGQSPTGRTSTSPAEGVRIR